MLYDTIPNFNDLSEKNTENYLGNREKAANQHFLLFSNCFLLFHRQINPFELHQNSHPVNAKDLNKYPKFYALVNPLPDDKILDWTKLKQYADNILKCI